MDRPPPRRRTPTHDEVVLWRYATRDVVPRDPRLEPLPADEPKAESIPTGPAARAEARPQRSARSARPTQRLDPTGPVDLDRRTWQRLRRGQYPVDARIDLHGLTQIEAYDALARFLPVAQQRGNRCVLVITGRAIGRGGTLREMTPRWLDEPPHRGRVLAYATAQTRHGGDGALYVLLRRRP